MSTQITTAFVQQYGANVKHLSQQMGSKLRSAVRLESQTGENAFYEQIGSVSARVRPSRHADTPLMDTPHDRRRVTLVDYDWADLVDQEDKIRMLIDPTSPYAQNAVWAMGRAMDELLIESALGDASTGKTGGTTTAFDTTNNQIAAGAAGLTIAKLIQAKEILDAGDVDPSIPRFIATKSGQISDLLNTTQATSADYNTIKTLVEGKIDTFMGFKFIQTELIGTSAASETRVIAWAQDGILLALGSDINVSIDKRPDKNNATQVFASMGIGATRMEEKKVVEILCV